MFNVSIREVGLWWFCCLQVIRIANRFWIQNLKVKTYHKNTRSLEDKWNAQLEMKIERTIGTKVQASRRNPWCQEWNHNHESIRDGTHKVKKQNTYMLTVQTKFGKWKKTFTLKSLHSSVFLNCPSWPFELSKLAFWIVQVGMIH